MSSKQVSLEIVIERLENEIKKLKMENKMLQTKNMILMQNCEEYTSQNEQQLAAHQLELNLAKVPIKNLQIKIKTLQKVNDRLHKQRDKYRQRIAAYEQEHIEYERTINENKELHQTLKKYKDKIEILKEKNMTIADELYTMKHIEMTSKDQRISELREQLREIHNRFERKLRRNASRSTNTLKIEMSETMATNRLLQSSSTLCYLSADLDSVDPQIHYRSPSISSVSKRVNQTKKNMKKRNLSLTQVSASYSKQMVDLYGTYDSNEFPLVLELDEVEPDSLLMREADAASVSLSRRSSTQFVPNYVRCFV